MADKKTMKFNPENLTFDQESSHDHDPEETRDWISAMKSVVYNQGEERAVYILSELTNLLLNQGASVPFATTTPYINTIDRDEEPPYPGNRDIERRIKSIMRWNAMAMVVRANNELNGIGGHIATYQSVATMFEVAFNHFFRARNDEQGGDQIFFQGHASPGIYARAFLEGRLEEKHLLNFRRELAEEGGLSSYPHPRLMPDFWQFPTVSMGLGPLQAIYQARFNRYLENRGLLDTSDSRVWAFVGDGETDEPETLAALYLASREKLDNLTFVVNCNLQRLDGPVRGNSKIIQELEGRFRGAGWKVIKVIWGNDWDPLLEQDKDGELVRRMNATVDGQYQKYSVMPGDYIRKDFFQGKLAKLVENMTDDQIRKLRRGGHDPQKVYAAFHAATNTKGRPAVVLCKTVKGYGMGEQGEAMNITHQQKKLNEQGMLKFRDRFGLPLSDEEVKECAFYKPAENSAEIEYLKTRREALGGSVPRRSQEVPPLPMLEDKTFEKFYGDFEGSTTMGFVRILTKLMSHKKFGKHVVPIIPDEARTFGIEALFRKYGIYSPGGQLYEPVDSDTLMSYKEKVDGQVLQEGINEAGATASFIAAATSASTHGLPMVPFYIFYSMFGFQRVGDSIWSAADMKARGFLLGATAGRTTLNGEGLQHQDGHSHILASTVPNLQAYDPTYLYELNVIIRDGLQRMYVHQEDVFYYLTVYNENYQHPEMPKGAEEGILRGLYKFRSSPSKAKKKAHIFSSGPIFAEAIRAAEILEDKYKVATDVWSATSFKRLRQEAMDAERWNRFHPEETSKKSYLEKTLAEEEGVFVAATDYMAALPDMISPWVPGGLTSLGTDGFGRSESRQALRRLFEVDGECIVIATLQTLARRGEIEGKVVAEAIKDLDVDPEKFDGMHT